MLNEYHESQKETSISNNVLDWLNRLSNWHGVGLVSEKEFSNALNYLIKKGTINHIPKEIKYSSEIKIKKNTNLDLVKFRNSIFNEGSPIVFEGKLTDSFGNFIPNAPILIKGDGPCPANHIIAQGVTDKHGRFKIYTHTQLWGEKDGLITTHAEFPGTNEFESSFSDNQLVVVYAVNGEKCIG